ncbi:MAG: ImmA/IrrE family metallo-endopeptidase [Bryobacterales bacterium]|nr:ImmA/IrrE family metallo-endopeptidase [Bryobacterales bacterium]
MALNKAYVEQRAAELLRQGSCVQAPELVSLSLAQHVTAVILRDQFSDGSLEVVPGGFRIYLKSVTPGQIPLDTSEPQLPVRMRFTWAHELAHTMFYELPDGPNSAGDLPFPRRPRPRKDRLEALCQYGAAAILIPLSVLRERYGILTTLVPTIDLFSLARELKVSVEAIVRRLDSIEIYSPAESAQVLVERSDERPQWSIIACRCGSWVAATLGRPPRYTPLREWLRARQPLADSAGVIYNLEFGDIRLEWQLFHHPRSVDRMLVECRLTPRR